jgi:hypothetical protein
VATASIDACWPNDNAGKYADAERMMGTMMLFVIIASLREPVTACGQLTK